MPWCQTAAGTKTYMAGVMEQPVKNEQFPAGVICIVLLRRQHTCQLFSIFFCCQRQSRPHKIPIHSVQRTAVNTLHRLFVFRCQRRIIQNDQILRKKTDGFMEKLNQDKIFLKQEIPDYKFLCFYPAGLSGCRKSLKRFPVPQNGV